MVDTYLKPDKPLYIATDENNRKLFECLNAKLPVLASNFPELSQAIIKNDFGLVCEPTTNSIVKSLKKITKRTFKKNLPKEYFWNYQEKQLLLAYRTLIKDI